MKETDESYRSGQESAASYLMTKPLLLCERVAGNGWAQESSQHSVESGVDLLVPCREREVI